MTIKNQELTDDQKAELTKIKSDPRYSDMKRVVKICMDDIFADDENPNPPKPKQKEKEEPDNIFDKLAGFFS